MKRYLLVILILFAAGTAFSAVEIDGDSNGAVDISKGGTNATTAANARTALGITATNLGLTDSGGYFTTDNVEAALQQLGLAGGDDLGSAAYGDVVALWTTCTGYLKSDGTCDTPSGSFSYPGAGVPLSTGSAWGTSYTVGTAANNLVQLNASAQLPAVSGALITGSWTGTLLSGQTTHTGAIQTIATELDSAVDLTFSTGLTDTSGTITVTYPVTAEAFSGSGWNGDTGGLARNDAYDYVHLFDTDDDGLPNKVDLSSAGLVKTDADGVLAVATAGTDYMSSTNLATGSTDNAVLRADGTGGMTTQASGVTIDDNNNMVVPGTIKSRVVFNTYSADQTLTAASHNSSVVQMTAISEVTMWDCETANVGDSVMLWARDAEKIEVVPASGDQFYLFNGTGIGADEELDVAATAGTKVTLMCTADDSWSVIHETSTSTDGGTAD